MYLLERSLEKRYCDGYYDYNCDYYNSPWNTWGRWVLLVVIIVVVLAIFFIFSCITARRRRKFGQQPFIGTGWMAPGHGQVNYYGPNGANNQQSGQYYPQNTAGNDPAPPYNPSNQGYYGQQSGYEMQPPPQTYQPGVQSTYAPPAGPPPGKQ